MLCPTCKTALTMTERQGVEIDYCPQCRGVWLDRGELDKIIERSNVEPERSHHDDDRRGSHPQQRYRDEPSGITIGIIRNASARCCPSCSTSIK